MTFSRLSYSESDRVLTLVLKNSEKELFLDEELIKELHTAVAGAAKSPEVKVIVLASGNESFCSGFSSEYYKKISTNDFNAHLEESRTLSRLLLLLVTMKKPVIAAVSGDALREGLTLALACDIITASEKVTMGFPEISSGLLPAAGLIMLGRRIGMGKARSYLFEGRILTADEALKNNLIDHIFTDGSVLQQSEALGAEICRTSSSAAMGLVKEMSFQLNGMNLPDALDYSANMNALARMSDDGKRGIKSLANNLPIEW